MARHFPLLPAQGPSTVGWVTPSRILAVGHQLGTVWKGSKRGAHNSGSILWTLIR